MFFIAKRTNRHKMAYRKFCLDVRENFLLHVWSNCGTGYAGMVWRQSNPTGCGPEQPALAASALSWELDWMTYKWCLPRQKS